MNIQGLQTMLQLGGFYNGMLDGQFGPLTGGAIMLALTDGPDTRLTEQDFIDAAEALDLQPAHVKAFAKVESAGSGFAEGRPVLLFEPHRFSRATKGVYDLRAPNVSYPKWDRSRYPRTQAQRYGQLLQAVGLNVDAGFASASYGKFQVLGENFKVCGYDSPFAFALGQAKDEASQLRAFMKFCQAKGIIPLLKAQKWDQAADIYNGTASRLNNYGEKLEAAFEEAGGR